MRGLGLVDRCEVCGFTQVRWERQEEGQDPFWVLYNFPGAAVTKSHQLGLSRSSGGQKSDSKVHRAVVPLKTLRESPSLLFQLLGVPFLPCLCVLFCLIRTLSLDLGLSLIQGDLIPILSLITSAKTLFSNKALF